MPIHAGSVPVLVAKIGGADFHWRGFEMWCGQLKWPQTYQPLFISARSAANLLKPSSWRMSEAAPAFSK